MKALWNIPKNNLTRDASSHSLQAYASSSSKLSSDATVNCTGIDQLREQLFARGVRGIVSLQRRFRIMDDDSSGALNLVEFKKGIRECNLSMVDSDLNALFNYFDRDRNGSISFNEFIEGVRVRK